MATQFSNATVAPQPTPYHHAYKKSGQYTPVHSSGNSPLTVSPTSPHDASHLYTHTHHAPPLRPLKTPLYVPAALRRTEKRQSPPKADIRVDTPNSSWSTKSSFGSGAGDISPITRVQTEDINSIYNDMPLSPIAGPITRNHWQPDTSAPACSASSCQQSFNWRTRRHHCRKCGGIFCWQHSQKVVRLNEHALFHPDGDWQRSCDRCHTQFREWEQMRSSRTNSESSGSGTAAVEIDTPQALRPENARVGSLATSFGGNWNWSTF
ncbi:hypothetical protein P280DRAFT_286554 [Massarina eburnea CBS 473.64]|uniref:FYVE-type domain-containing protein n=1 Tax=Massarina eburnea CBS 473.64 TaxID=1395130 RepID=A0A6A6S2U4_9PLEO|nr:hypothetical protein P280DRAFT_286554 [Massarina eburnea CBS 473.64]